MAAMTLEEAKTQLAELMANKPAHRQVTGMSAEEYRVYTATFLDWDKKTSKLRIEIDKLERPRAYGKGVDWAAERFVPRACA